MILYSPIKNTLSNSDKTIKIGYRESKVLALLLERSPEVVKKQDIIQFTWGNEFVGETSLAKSISVLRQHFAKFGIKDSPIVTVPKVGYRLIEGAFINEDLAKTEPQYDKITKDTPESSLPFYAAKKKSDYKALACYTVALSLLFSGVLMIASKYHSPESHPKDSKPLTKHTVGTLEVFTAQNTVLTTRVKELLAQNQCQCVVYIEKNAKIYGLSWLNKQTRKSLNVFYSPDQFEQASRSITEFVAEETQ
ncbi:winged helix-turn-helix domain-containing protein [Vibrio sp. AND4]|uniref:winged helix-turn-helix domain-containing protein n=1 Tax=Vibrio sp. AND4 TaxID=314289 RepID=UPI00015EFAEE|nr:winged helix-turn-helix domain-containing protein [Vibrio sp. AND4]EDP59923.1 putative transcriptional activator ToxR [Vibrio sp. AND4]